MPVAPPSPPDSQGPLRRDVRLLGALLGHVILEQEGQALYDASPSAHKRLVRIPGADHNDIMLRDPQAYFSAIGRLAAEISP